MQSSKDKPFVVREKVFQSWNKFNCITYQVICDIKIIKYRSQNYNFHIFPLETLLFRTNSNSEINWRFLLNNSSNNHLNDDTIWIILFDFLSICFMFIRTLWNAIINILSNSQQYWNSFWKSWLFKVQWSILSPFYVRSCWWNLIRL